MAEIDGLVENRFCLPNAINRVYSNSLQPRPAVEVCTISHLRPLPDERLPVCAHFAYNAQLQINRALPFLTSNGCGINPAPLAGAPVAVVCDATGSFAVGYYPQSGNEQRVGVIPPDTRGKFGALFPTPMTPESLAIGGLALTITMPNLSLRSGNSPTHNSHVANEYPGDCLTWSYAGGLTLRLKSLNAQLQFAQSQETTGVDGDTVKTLEARQTELAHLIKNYESQSDPTKLTTAEGRANPIERLPLSDEEQEQRQEVLRRLEEERQKIQEQIDAARQSVDEHTKILENYVKEVEAAWGKINVPPPENLDQPPPSFGFDMVRTTPVNLQFEKQPKIVLSQLPSLVTNKSESRQSSSRSGLLQQITKFVSSLTGFQIPTNWQDALQQGLTLIQNGRSQRLHIDQFAQLGSAQPLALIGSLLEELNLPPEAKKIVGFFLPLLNDPAKFLSDPMSLLKGLLSTFNVPVASELVDAVGGFVKNPNFNTLMQVALLSAPADLLGPLSAIHEAYLVTTDLFAGMGMRNSSITSVGMQQGITTGARYFAPLPSTAYEYSQSSYYLGQFANLDLTPFSFNPPNQTGNGSTAYSLDGLVLATNDLYLMPAGMLPNLRPEFPVPDLSNLPPNVPVVLDFSGQVRLLEDYIRSGAAASPIASFRFINSNSAESLLSPLFDGNINPISLEEDTIFVNPVLVGIMRRRISHFSLGSCSGISEEVRRLLDNFVATVNGSNPQQSLNHILTNYFYVQPFNIYEGMLDLDRLVAWVQQNSPENTDYLQRLVQGDVVGFFVGVIHRESGIDVSTLPEVFRQLRQLVNCLYLLGVHVDDI